MDPHVSHHEYLTTCIFLGPTLNSILLLGVSQFIAVFDQFNLNKVTFKNTDRTLTNSLKNINSLYFLIIIGLDRKGHLLGTQSQHITILNEKVFSEEVVVYNFISHYKFCCYSIYLSVCSPILMLLLFTTSYLTQMNI